MQDDEKSEGYWTKIMDVIKSPFKGLSTMMEIKNTFGINTTDKMELFIRKTIASAVNEHNIKTKGYLSSKSTGKETFQELYDIFGKDLICTGTCYNYGRAFYFSRFHSNDMPVFIAITISSCFPGHFKPYVWGNDLLWGDGGIVQNLPYVMSTEFCKKVLAFTIINSPHCESLGNYKKSDTKWSTKKLKKEGDNTLPFGCPPKSKNDYPGYYKEINSAWDFISQAAISLGNGQNSPIIPLENVNDVIEFSIDDDITALSKYIPESIKKKYIKRGYIKTKRFFEHYQ